MGTRTLGLLAAGAVTLTGCTGGGEDPETSSTSIATPTSASSSTPSSSATSSPSPSSSRPSASLARPPAAAAEDSKRGAEVFGEWFWKSLGESVAVGDTSTPKKYSTSTCSVCKEALEGTQAAADRYGTADSNPYRVEVESSEYEAGRSFVKMHVAFDDYELKKGGTVGANIKGDSSDLVLEVRYAQGSWKAQKWTLLR